MKKTALPLLAIPLLALACLPVEPDPDPNPEPEPNDDPCEVSAPLGTFTLGAGFTLVDTAALPEGVVRVAVRESGEAFGLRGESQDVVPLGTWPSLSAAAPLGSVLPPGFSGEVFLSPWLSVSDGAVAAGYTEPFDPDTGAIPGKVATDVESAAFVDAPGNFTAAFFGDALLINGLGLGDEVGASVYFTSPVGDGVFATIPEALGAFSGYTLVTPGGFVVVGAFYDGANQLHGATAEQAAAAFSGAPLVLDQLPSVASGDFTDASAFGAGVALLKAPFDAPVEGVDRVPLLAEGGGLVGGAPAAVLERGAADCTQIDFLAPFGDELLVGLSGDSEGPRAARIAVAE